MYTQVKMTPEQKAFAEENLVYETNVANIMAQYTRMGFNVKALLDDSNTKGISDNEALLRVFLSWRYLYE